MNSPNLHNNTSHKPKKWTMFTYYSPLLQKITNLFRHTDVRIAFRNTNTIYDILKLKTTSTTVSTQKVEFTN